MALAVITGESQGQSAVMLPAASGRLFASEVDPHRLAAQGDSAALNSLALMYQSGSGVPLDLAKAYALFHLAASLPNAQSAQAASASQSRDSVALKMSAAQLAQAQDLLTRCYGDDIRLCGERIVSGGLAVASLSTPATPAGKRIIPLENFHGIYLVSASVNGAANLKFALDTGATDVAIPADVVSILLKDGTIAKADFLGERTYVLADGSRMPSQTFRIRSLKVGDVTVEDVRASVTPEKGALLLGQSFFRRLKSWSMDNKSPALIIE